MSIGNTSRIALATAAVLAAGWALPAFAQQYTSADDKIMTGAACMPALGAAYGDFDIRATYIQNISAGNRWLACSLPVDSEQRWGYADSSGATDSGDATISVSVRYGSTIGTSVCNAQAISLSSGAVLETASVSIDNGQPNTTYVRYFPSMFEGDANGVAVGVNCRLTPGARLFGFNIEEYADTDPQIIFP